MGLQASGFADESQMPKSHLHLNMCKDSVDTGAGDVHRGDGQSGDGHKGQRGNGHRGQTSGLVRDRLLVAANAALASLAGNADTHFAMVNEGAAPALVTALQHGMFPLCMLACRLHVSSLTLQHPHESYRMTHHGSQSVSASKDLKSDLQVMCTCQFRELAASETNLASYKACVSCL